MTLPLINSHLHQSQRIMTTRLLHQRGSQEYCHDASGTPPYWLKNAHLKPHLYILINTIIFDVFVFNLILWRIVAIILEPGWLVFLGSFLFAGHYTFKLYRQHIIAYIYISCANLSSLLGSNNSIDAPTIHFFSSQKTALNQLSTSLGASPSLYLERENQP